MSGEMKEIQLGTIEIGEIFLKLIYFDSLGAKCSSVLVKTPDLSLLIDPGAAGMQPGYPLAKEEKEKFRLLALRKIAEASCEADSIFISHYHYDHHILPKKIPEGLPLFYIGKTIYAKDPNKWINHSQFDRARKFFEELYRHIGVEDEFYIDPQEVEIPDIEKELPLALSKDYGSYSERKKQLLSKGKEWLLKLSKEVWEKEKWVKALGDGETNVHFVDGREIKKGETTLRFSKPHYHGIEYDRVGWVISLVVEHKGHKFLYSSDLQGPQIEDYADWIIKENPDVIVLDGPPTYIFGFMMNRTNLNRALHNIERIAEETKADPIIYDHHLLREPKYRERLHPVYEKYGDRIRTAAEIAGKNPLILELTKSKR